MEPWFAIAGKVGSGMAADRLHKDFDRVENLDDLIEAREERDSAFSDDVDGMPDADVSGVDIDVSHELGYPHHHGPSKDQKEGLNVELMDTPKERDVEFDWQDSVEEMNATDPEPDEGMGEDTVLRALGQVDAADLVGPVPSTDIGAETATAATKEEKEEYDLDGGDGQPCCPPRASVPLETAMDTDSDENDFSIEDKFAGEVDHETAEFEFEEMRQLEKEPKGKQ
jgi:hypothetical protein